MNYDILENAKNRMQKCLSVFEKNLNNIRIDRASPTLLDNIVIEYYGSKIPLRELSNITSENANTLKINIFDKNIIRIVEKAIFHSKLGVTPVVNNNVIRVVLPPLTEERRKKICKYIQLDVENSRINIRNIRRDVNDILKEFIKKKTITIDIQHIIQNEIQTLTNNYIDKINNLFIKKKTEIMNI